MRKILSQCILLAVVTPLEAQPWRKPVEKWSVRDARRVLTSSPWAKRIDPTVQTPDVKPGSGASDLPFPLSTLTVRWESGAPVIHARRLSGLTPLTVESQAYYEIGITGFRIDQQDAASVLSAAQASLRYCDGDPVKAASVRVLRNSDGGPLLVFRFPEAEGVRDPGVFRLPFGVTFHPNKFHFVARIGPVEIRQTFDVRDMLYLNKLSI